MAEYNLIGKSFVPQDLVAKITGRAKYAEDFRAEGMLSRRRTGYVSYPIGSAYREVKSLIDGAADGRYQKVQELLDERIRRTPDVARWLDSRWDW